MFPGPHAFRNDGTIRLFVPEIQKIKTVICDMWHIEANILETGDCQRFQVSFKFPIAKQGNFEKPVSLGSRFLVKFPSALPKLVYWRVSYLACRKKLNLVLWAYLGWYEGFQW